MTIKKIILLVILLILTVGIVYVALNSDFVKTLITDNSPAPSYIPVATFSDLAGNKTKSDKLSPDVEETFKSPEDKLIFQYGWDLITVDLDSPWDYKTMPIDAKIDEYNQINKTLKLTVLGPSNAPLLDKEITVPVLTDCTEKNTFVTNETDANTYQQNNFLEELKPGRYLKSFCTDEKCTSLHRLCKISYYTDLPNQ